MIPSILPVATRPVIVVQKRNRHENLWPSKLARFPISVPPQLSGNGGFIAQRLIEYCTVPSLHVPMTILVSSGSDRLGRTPQIITGFSSNADSTESFTNMIETVNDSSAVELWPACFLGERRLPRTGDTTVALVILNSPISDLGCLKSLYSNASYCICADAGADRLHDILTMSNPDRSWEDSLNSALPNSIHGDLDSLSERVRDRYESLGVDVSRDPDQYSTDFGKCIKKVIQNAPSVKQILVLGSLGGRIDQGVGLLHELYREQKFRIPNVQLWFFSEASITFMLRPGSTIIHTDLTAGCIERNVGVLPVYGPAVISTSGLEWDVENWHTEMGGQVSTSNHIVDDQVRITTNTEVLFTIERSISK